MIILSDDTENTDVPMVNTALIVANVLIFFWMLANVSNHEYFYFEHGTVPVRFACNHDLSQFVCILTSMFIHGGFLHLLSNMWVLYLFGDNVEDRLGHLTYLIFYLACGVFADLGHILVNPSSTLPCVGASGAIAGVMGAYMILHPNAKCKTWWGDDSIFFAFRTYQVPASLVIGGWFVLQVFAGLLLPAELAGIAFIAHVAGFVAGLLLLLVLDRHDGESFGLSGRHGTLLFLSTIGLTAMIYMTLPSVKAWSAGLVAHKDTARPSVSTAAKPRDQAAKLHAQTGQRRTARRNKTAKHHSARNDRATKRALQEKS